MENSFGVPDAAALSVVLVAAFVVQKTAAETGTDDVEAKHAQGPVVADTAHTGVNHAPTGIGAVVVKTAAVIVGVSEAVVNDLYTG